MARTEKKIMAKQTNKKIIKKEFSATKAKANETENTVKTATENCLLMCMPGNQKENAMPNEWQHYIYITSYSHYPYPISCQVPSRRE